MVDAHSVKTPATLVRPWGKATRGYDSGRKISDAKNVSSSEGKTGSSRGREGYSLIEWDPLSQTVMEAGDHPVEAVPLGGRVPVCGLTPAVVVSRAPSEWAIAENPYLSPDNVAREAGRGFGDVTVDHWLLLIWLRRRLLLEPGAVVGVVDPPRRRLCGGMPAEEKAGCVTDPASL